MGEEQMREVGRLSGGKKRGGTPRHKQRGKSQPSAGPADTRSDDTELARHT